MVRKILPPGQAAIDKTLRILIIEDNPGDIIIIRELLKTTGTQFILTNAVSLKESIHLLKNDHFDVIILDLGLPDSSGLKTLREFLNTEISPPVIILTGLDDEETALASLREGAEDYLVKNSLGSESILRSIKYSIERKKLENLRKKNSSQISILSEATAAFFEDGDIPHVYKTVCNSTRRLLNDSIVFSLEYVKSETYRIANTDQLSHLSDQFRTQSSGKPDGLSFNPMEQNAQLINLFGDGFLHKLDSNTLVYEGKGRAIQLDEIAFRLGTKGVYVIGIFYSNINYGGLVIFTQSEIEEDDSSFIENICRQASLTIFRRIMKSNLIVSEAKYQKLAGELEEKVKERTAELEAANKQLLISEAQLKELNATKDKFFNIVAHDLKNPFTSLLGATELLFNNIQSMEKEKIRKLAQILNDSAKSGYAILLNLLDWSRSQTGTIKMNIQRIDLKKVIDENIAEIYLNCTDKDIRLISEFDSELNIDADKNMLNTVLRNLISNAVKFTRRGGKIVITGEIRDTEVLISVKDNGIGIAREHLNTLFRIDSKYSRPGTEKELGTGLGLKLSREFVEKLGGRIWVESSENEGSTFTFTLPLQTETIARQQ